MQQDSTQYGFQKIQSTETYTPFSSFQVEENNNLETNSSKNPNFCPTCGYNYQSHYHRKHCNNVIPIESGFFILLFFLGFYIIYKKIKTNYNN